MYLVTNRAIDESRTGLDVFGDRPSAQGPNELRLVEIRRWGRGLRTTVVPDRLDEKEAGALCEEFGLDFDPQQTCYGSFRAACDVVRRARAEKKHVLFYVHGYNNDIRDSVERALDLEERFGVIVLPFSWPANGGGAVSGTLSYKADKRDARASAGALERLLMKAADYLQLLSASARSQAFERACRQHPGNFEQRDRVYARLIERDCGFTVNALFHSMGNYLLKQMLKSSITEGNRLLFDNIVLCAADTNNAGHADWVERLRFRKRIFITINENDFALQASRMKAGSDQRARLGHCLRHLDAGNANYINFTPAPHVRDSHAYFDSVATRNKAVRAFFDDAFRGRAAEAPMIYRPAGNYFELRA